MTSAALADCHGAIAASASKARRKRTVFIRVAPVDWRNVQHGRRQYRPRVNVLRRPCCFAAWEPQPRTRRSDSAFTTLVPKAKKPGGQTATGLKERARFHSLAQMLLDSSIC